MICGEIVVAKRGSKFVLGHRADRGEKTAHPVSHARELATFDDAGNFRPLKTAPTLRRGWEIHANDWHEVELALDQFYPGRLGIWRAWKNDALERTPLRATLDRQTGRYRAARQISDEQIAVAVEGTCTGCLRTILWRRDGSGELPSRAFPDAKYEVTKSEERRLPLLCQEACAILIEACRCAAKAVSA